MNTHLSAEKIVESIIAKRAAENCYQEFPYYITLGELYNHLHELRFAPSPAEQNAILAREHGAEMGYEWQVAEGWHG